MRKLLINNAILIAQKPYNPIQSKLLYELTYRIKMLRQHEVGCEESIILEVSLEDMRSLIKEGTSIYSEKKLVDGIMKGDLLRKDITLLTNDYNVLTGISAFRKTKYHIDEQYFEFKFNEDYLEVAETLDESFGEMLLNEYGALLSNYSKRVYELYCKFKGQKHYLMPIEHLRKYFNVPKTYHTGLIDQRIINKGIQEITEVTNGKVNIKVSKVKKGKNITHYKFIF